MSENHRYDVLIVGSSFTGSLLAWILQKQGRSVCLIDRGKHPRFAIGESSTPTADFLVAHLADRWGLRELAPLACWGSWKEHYPEIVCGKKRGFSYYHHQAGQEFSDDESHSHSLLVAASSDDRYSDTHWLRSDVDYFLWQQARRSGVACREQCQLVSAELDAAQSCWHVELDRLHEAPQRVEATWLIDASGGGGAIAKWVGQHDDSEWMRTRTGALFAHFTNVADFAPLSQSADDILSDPFSGDDAAQHHIVEDGWYWMLRFDNRVTSVGLVRPTKEWPQQMHDVEFAKQYWQDHLDCYPGVRQIMSQASVVAPHDGLRFQARLSRCANRAAGKQWAAIPTAAGFIDPLHSTGIAHGLSGVARLAEILLANEHAIQDKLDNYGRQVRNEIEWLDTLVAGCYLGLPSFDLFRAFASLYFVAAIEFEKQMAADPAAWPQGYMMADHVALRQATERCYQELTLAAAGIEDDARLVQSIRTAIAPWNTVGLLAPQLKNRLAHTTAPKYASTVFQ